jgi:CubicO group peptidase (beta-lactamase class C family)
MAPTTAALGSSLAARVGTVVQGLLALDNIPGMAVAVTYQGQVVLAQGYGVLGDVAGTPVGADTPFGVGSVSKTFTAISTLLIAQDPSLIDTSQNPGITSLQLDQPIGTYLAPGTPISLPMAPSGKTTFTLPTAWADVTPRQLLDMSGGLPDNLGYIPWNDAIAQLIKNNNTTLAFTPGSQYLYSNVGFFVLGALIEKLTDVPYSQFVQQHILTPLGMNDSTVLTGTNSTVSGEAVGYQTYDTATGSGTTPSGGYYSGEDAFSAGAVVSSAADLGKYMSALWDESSLLLDPASYQAMWTPVSLISNKDPSKTVTPGLGWDGVDATAQGTIIWKNGAVPGYSAQISLYESSGFGIAVAYNLSAPTFVAGNFPVQDAINAIYGAVSTGGVSGSLATASPPGQAQFPLVGWTVYIDANHDGHLDPGDPSTVTNAQGSYNFPNVPPGQVTIGVVPPPGWWPVSPSNGALTVSILAAGDATGPGITFAQLATVTGAARSRIGHRTALVLNFSEPMDPAGVTDPANYRLSVIIPAAHRRVSKARAISIRTITSSASAQTAIVVARNPHKLNGRIQVEVIASGITNLVGLDLDGGDIGRPGNNFIEQLAPGGRGAAVTQGIPRVRLAAKRIGVG